MIMSIRGRNCAVQLWQYTDISVYIVVMFMFYNDSNSDVGLDFSVHTKNNPYISY